MGIITSIRAPIPVAEALLQPSPVDPRGPLAARQGTAAPATMLAEAPQQVSAKPAANDTDLLHARMTNDGRATEAAEAAKKAYILASIAAGINPLPLS